MIRDPSDGTVREKSKNVYWCPGCSDFKTEPCHHFHCPLGDHGLLKSDSIREQKGDENDANL